MKRKDLLGAASALVFGLSLTAVPVSFEPTSMTLVSAQALAQGKGGGGKGGGQSSGNAGSKASNAGSQRGDSGSGGQGSGSTGTKGSGGGSQAGNTGGAGSRAHVSSDVRAAVANDAAGPGASEWGQQRGLGKGRQDKEEAEAPEAAPGFAGAPQAPRAVVKQLSRLDDVQLRAYLTSLTPAQMAALAGACGGGGMEDVAMQNVCSAAAGGGSGGGSGDGSGQGSAQ